MIFPIILINSILGKEHITRSTTELKQLFTHYLYLSVELESFEQSRNGHNNDMKY